jgi:hypothetical protein
LRRAERRAVHRENSSEHPHHRTGAASRRGSTLAGGGGEGLVHRVALVAVTDGASLGSANRR